MTLSPRSRVEHASAPWVERLHAVPLPVRIAVVAAVVAAGILAPRPWGGVAFLLLAAFLGWLLFLTWQRLTLPERLMRIAVLALAGAAAIVRLVPTA
ncbi:MAG: hypothetical protein L0H25_04285 [Micrococcales bacterium]|nr:hypothetical protein [Micrococcales bacterium]